MSDDPESTMSEGALSVKISYINKDIQKHEGSIKELEKHKIEQEGKNKSYEKFKTSMEDLEVKARIEDLEDNWKSRKHNKDQALTNKQSRLPIYISAGLTVLIFLYTILKDLFSG